MDQGDRENGSTYWWLRSPGNNDTDAVSVRNDGSVAPAAFARSKIGVRPAFKLDMDSVLFASAATGGKSGAVSADLSAAEPPNGEQKLTILDSGHTLTTATTTETLTENSTITVNYNGANTGTDVYLSAIVTDAAGAITHYGALVENLSSESGTAQVTLPDGFDRDTMKLKLFTETKNDPNITNYASELVTVEAPPTEVIISMGTAPTASPVTEGAKLSTSTLTGGKVIETGTSNEIVGTWAWTTGNTIVSATGNYEATFTPTPQGGKIFKPETLTQEISVTANPAVIKPVKNTNTSNEYETLQAAIDAATSGDTLKLQAAVTENVTIANNSNSYTLDLNGKTLDGGSNKAITHNGKGTLTITDTGTGGTVTSGYTDAYSGGTISLNRGTKDSTVLEITGGTVENTSTTTGRTISNNAAGTVSITGGEVIATGTNGKAINNNEVGTVSITGGEVSTTGTFGMTISNYKTGKITISDTAKVTSNNTSESNGTIFLRGGTATDTVLEITGGTVENTATAGNAIYNNAPGTKLSETNDPVDNQNRNHLLLLHRKKHDYGQQ